MTPSCCTRSLSTPAGRIAPPGALPTRTIARRPASIDGYAREDFAITGHDPHPHGRAEVVV